MNRGISSEHVRSLLPRTCGSHLPTPARASMGDDENPMQSSQKLRLAHSGAVEPGDRIPLLLSNDIAICINMTGLELTRHQEYDYLSSCGH